MRSAFAKRRRGEPAIVAEQAKPDPVIKRLGDIRQHRLQKAELDVAQARRHAQAMRVAMREAHDVAQNAEREAQQFWIETMHQFRAMALTLNEFLGCKGRHIKLKREVLAFKEDTKRAVGVARQSRQAILEAQVVLRAQQLGVEKFRLMRETEKEEAERKVVE
jgi:hypothetical protein